MSPGAIRLGAVVLAAGRSRRMGTQKLLLPLGGQPVIARVVEVLCRCPLEPVVVVVGADGPRLREALAGYAVRFTVNPDPGSEMLESVRCGLRALPASCAGVLVAPGDHPGICTALVQALLREFAANPRGLVVPVHNGQRGHPLLFDSRYRAEVLHAHDRVGLRGLLAAHPNAVREVPIGSPAAFEDLDRPADYERARVRFKPNVLPG